MHSTATPANDDIPKVEDIVVRFDTPARAITAVDVLSF